MSRCETCNGYGYVTEFRRFAGEYQAGEPVDVVCRDCEGEGEWDDSEANITVSPEDRDRYREWLAGLEPGSELKRAGGWL